MATLNYNWQLLKETGFTVVGNNGLRLYGKLYGQDINGNRSTVAFQLRVIAYSGSFYSTQNTSDLWCAGVHRGTRYYDIGNVSPSRGEITVGDWSFDLYHDGNGNLSTAVAGNSNVYGSTTPSTGDVWFDCPSIPRVSNVTTNKNSYTIGEDIIVYTNRKSSSFTHVVEFSFGTYKKTVSNVTTSTTINTSDIKENLYSQIPSAKSGTAKIILTTYNGNNYLGQTTKNITLNVNETECTPVLSDFTIKDIDTTTLSLTGNNQNFIKGFSDLQYDVTAATPKYSATITKYRFADNQETSELTHVTTNVDNQIASVVAIDSRGLSSNVVTKNINLLDYSLPKINDLEPLRENGIDVYVNMRVQANIWKGNFGNGNNKIAYFGYSVNGGDFYDKTSEFNELLVSRDINNIDATIRIYSDGSTSNFEIGKSYTINVKIKDGLDNKPFNEATLTAIIQDGKVAIAFYQDYEGEYHIGLNGMPRDDSVVAINGLRFIYEEGD